ncbi:MAG: Thiol-disulfide isomerase [bacterium]|nr:Thiol-disulfide isomerase [bacterium]
MRHLILTVVLALSLISVRVMGDASPDVRAQAKQHYEAGETFFRLGEWDHAIAEWRQSYELSRVPLLLYDMAQAYRQKGDAKQALFFYQQYLTIAPTGESRDGAEKRVAELKQVLAAQQSAQAAPPQGPVRPAVTATQSEGSHEPMTTTPEPSAPHRNRVALAFGWSSASVGVAALAVSAGLLGAAASERNDALAAPTQTAFDMHHANSLTLQQGGWPLLGIGAALVVAGTVVLVLNAKKGHER